VDRDSFDATDLIEEMKQAVASLEEKIITINPIDSWDILFFEESNGTWRSLKNIQFFMSLCLWL